MKKDFTETSLTRKTNMSGIPSLKGDTASAANLHQSQQSESETQKRHVPQG